MNYDNPVVATGSVATLLAIEFGFTAVVLFALALYVTTAAIIHDYES